MVVCEELPRINHRIHVDFSQYRSYLHHGGQKIITEWFQRASEMKESRGSTCFEAFFDTWVAFNGWAVCITNEDRDSLYIKALVHEPRLCQDFAHFTNAHASPLALASAQFASFWPIFDVRKLRSPEMHERPRDSREDTITYYLEHNITSFAPRCAKRHRDNGEPIPIDWPHVLVALYQVRCNFFHGGKMISSEEDQLIVASAYKTLLFFLEQGRYIQ